jgi:hypothetical protein
MAVFASYFFAAISTAICELPELQAPIELYMLNVRKIIMKHLGTSILTSILICVLFLVCACSRGDAVYGAPSTQNRSRAAGGMAYDVAETAVSLSRGEYAEASAEPESPEPSIEAGNAEQGRKLIKRAEIRVRAENPAATEKPLADLMQKHGAWPASTGIYENSRNYDIRVPLSSYDAMLADLSGLGRVLRRTESAEDVTLRYYDLESRLETKRELLKTYQSYLGKASNIDEIMTVESRIADLQREIDDAGGRLRSLANLVDYSTIYLEILGSVNAPSYAEPTLSERLKTLFGSFGSVASQTLLVIVGIVVYGIPAILILILLFSVLFGRIGILKKIWRFAAGKKAKPSAEL